MSSLMASQDTWCLQFVHEAVEKEPEAVNETHTM